MSKIGFVVDIDGSDHAYYSVSVVETYIRLFNTCAKNVPFVVNVSNLKCPIYNNSIFDANLKYPRKYLTDTLNKCDAVVWFTNNGWIKDVLSPFSILMADKNSSPALTRYFNVSVTKSEEEQNDWGHSHAIFEQYVIEPVAERPVSDTYNSGFVYNLLFLNDITQIKDYIIQIFKKKDLKKATLLIKNKRMLLYDSVLAKCFESATDRMVLVERPTVNQALKLIGQSEAYIDLNGESRSRFFYNSAVYMEKPVSRTVSGYDLQSTPIKEAKLQESVLRMLNLLRSIADDKIETVRPYYIDTVIKTLPKRTLVSC